MLIHDNDAVVAARWRLLRHGDLLTDEDQQVFALAVFGRSGDGGQGGC